MLPSINGNGAKLLHMRQGQPDESMLVINNLLNRFNTKMSKVSKLIDNEYKSEPNFEPRSI